MFASTEPSGFPAAILSRLQRYDVRRLSVAEIEGKLTRILEADGRIADPAAVHLIARLAAGGMRDAESMLDQLLSSAPERINEQDVRELLGLADAEAVDAFVGALIDHDPAAGIALLDALDERGRDPRHPLDQALEQLRARLAAGFADPTSEGPPPAIAEACTPPRAARPVPTRAGIGGLRLQLELALFATAAEPGRRGGSRLLRRRPGTARRLPTDALAARSPSRRPRPWPRRRRPSGPTPTSRPPRTPSRPP